MDNEQSFLDMMNILSCPEEGCAPLKQYSASLIPSLEQIAGYNYALAYSNTLKNQNKNTNMQEQEQNISQHENALAQRPIATPYSLYNVPQNANTPQNQINTAPPQIESAFTEIPSNNLPYSMQTGAITSPQNTSGITDFSMPYKITAESIQYLNGFIRTQIGRRVEVEFLIGSNSTAVKEGYLLGVGANYILLNESYTNDLLACDFYNIKFIKFFY